MKKNAECPEKQRNDGQGCLVVGVSFLFVLAIYLIYKVEDSVCQQEPQKQYSTQIDSLQNTIEYKRAVELYNASLDKQNRVIQQQIDSITK